MGSGASKQSNNSLAIRYTKSTSLWEALQTGHVKLLRASWVIQLADKNGVLDRRQELPPEAFISVKELKRIFRNSGLQATQSSSNPLIVPIISISYCWETVKHPDPRGAQLKTVAARLKVEMVKYARVKEKYMKGFLGFKEMGIFWDWASLYQKDPQLFDENETPEAKREGPERDEFVAQLETGTKFLGGNAYEKSRSAEQTESFRYALHKTMDLWYVHQGTIVYMLTRATRTLGYDQSGWTSYERCSAEQIKPNYSFQSNVSFKLIINLAYSGKEAEAARRWPTDPDTFDRIVSTKTFTNGSDKTTVMELYRRMTIDQFKYIIKLNFKDMATPSVYSMQCLAKCLNLAEHLISINIDDLKISDDAGVAFFSALKERALPKLEYLGMQNNHLGDPTMQAIVDAVKERDVLPGFGRKKVHWQQFEAHNYKVKNLYSKQMLQTARAYLTRGRYCPELYVK